MRLPDESDLPSAIRLALDFEPAGLERDLTHIPADSWAAHFNTDIYSGEWSGVALRAPVGSTNTIDALHNSPNADGFEDLPLLEHCPNLRDVAARLTCELRSIRLLRLGPGAVIREHADHELGYRFGEVRLHVPVLTSPKVEFLIDGERVDMRPGQVWYVDASRPHSVRNAGSDVRTHLVIDCVVNRSLDDLLRNGQATTPSTNTASVTSMARDAEDAGWPLNSRYDEPVTRRIVNFLIGIGLEVGTRSLPERTLLPGIALCNGGIWIDPERLSHPGDLLHEAGRLAVTAAADRAALSGTAGVDAGDEMMAIAWSWAALTRLHLDPSEVFHADGYQGGAQWLIDTYAGGTFIALPTLQWIGLTADPRRASELGVEPYPNMLRWLRG